MEAIQLALFQCTDQVAVKQLVLDGLVEHWGLLDPTKNPGLDYIATTYAEATFLVARCGRKIVGCGALVPRCAQYGEIVRISVKKEFRGRGIGTMILNALCDAARTQGFERVILETTETWRGVVAFYLRNGFRITHYAQGDVYFECRMTLDVSR